MAERALRTYLELHAPSALRPARLENPAVRVERVHDCPPSFWRYLYTEVGRRWRWIDRIPWSEDTIRGYLADPTVSLWLLTVGGAPAGYFELRGDRMGGVEIAYLGLLEEFTGRGVGGHLLTVAVERAWEAGANRVWLHTSSLDHPAALTNYLRRGFAVFDSEYYEPGSARRNLGGPEETDGTP